MKLTPEVVLLGDHTMSRMRWTIDRETERIDALRSEHAEVDKILIDHGWSSRMLAMGHIMDGLCDLCAFDDEEGRT